MIYTDMTAMPQDHYAVGYVDPAWRFRPYTNKGNKRSACRYYPTMPLAEMKKLPVSSIMAKAAVLLVWCSPPFLKMGLELIETWEFEYKTYGFDWMKADVKQFDMFAEPPLADMKMGFWTRSNSEFCLLATRGKPKRLNADVRMGIIEKARQHSRKPDCVYPRIERLVKGPYVELFGRNERPGWDTWGNEVGKFREVTA